MSVFGCMSRLVLVLGLITLLNTNTAQAFSEFLILAPDSLSTDTRFTTPRPWDRNATGIQHLPALFGNPPYGDTIVANVFYPSQPANQLACQALDRTNETNWPSTSGENPAPFVLLLSRGSCTFKTKVRYAQAAGAAVVIVFGLQGDYLVYMADDKSQGSVTIPSVFIQYTDAQLLINQLSNNVAVTLAMSWSFEAPDDLVEWDLWTSSRDQTTFNFKQVFGAVEAALGSRTEFTPHYIFDRYQASQPYCMNNGRYCTPDPTATTPVGLAGREHVWENLRQICLFRVLNATGRTDLWWQYVSLFEQDCFLSSLWMQNDGACGFNIMSQTLKIDVQQVRSCMNVAPLCANCDNTHPVIEQERQAWRDAGQPWLPTVVINEEPYRGTIDCATPNDVATCPILQALCSGFYPGTQPDICGCRPGVKKDCKGVCGGTATCDASSSSSSSGVSIGAVIGIVIGGMVFIAIGIVIYMKRQKKEISDGMDHMLRQYLPMEDSESINHSGANGNRTALTSHP